ncbi:hypothetical protein FP568_09545 [Pandoraea pnomenusa]|nr:hypothetical protein FP568_09545 [Pandoraea pnomenusa]
MTELRESLLSQLGFRFGINGPHAARTMMLDDLRLLLSHTRTLKRRSVTKTWNGLSGWPWRCDAA